MLIKNRGRKGSLAFVLLQLKKQHKEHSEQRLAIEELERNIRLAEEVCPGITDRMVTHIIARYQTYVYNFMLQPPRSSLFALLFISCALYLLYTLPDSVFIYYILPCFISVQILYIPTSSFESFVYSVPFFLRFANK